MNNDVIEAIRPLLNLPSTMSKQNTAQTKALKEAVKSLHNSYNINDLCSEIRSLKSDINSLPKDAPLAPECKSVWWPAITIAIFSSILAATVVLSLDWYSRYQRPEIVAQWLLNQPKTEKVCKKIGFDLAKQSDGRVYCLKLINPGKQ